MIEYKLEITINDKTIKIAGINKAHFKNKENALKFVRREINRFIKSQIEKEENQPRNSQG